MDREAKTKAGAGPGNSQRRLYRRGILLEYFTIAYNLIEAAVSILFGKMAGSIALVGFGLDSIIESLSGFVLLWRLKKHGRISQREEERLEERASRFVGWTFFILGAYVLFESAKKLMTRDIPDPSLPGIIIAAISLIVMPVLAFRKKKVGEALDSRALVADSKETLACAFLSLALLLGLGVHSLTGFWPADPLAGIVIAGFLFREGYEFAFEK